MPPFYKAKIGDPNIFFIFLICCCPGILAFLWLGTAEEFNRLQEHWFKSFFLRSLGSVALITPLIFILLVLNLVYSLILRNKWYTNLKAITIWCLLGSLVASFAGNLIFMLQ